MAGCSSRRSAAASDSLKPRTVEPNPRLAPGSRLGPSSIVRGPCSSLTLSGVRSLSERCYAGEELWRLPVEQSHGGQGRRGAHGSAFRLAGPDDRAGWELPVEEFRRLGHDQVGLVELTAPV